MALQDILRRNYVPAGFGGRADKTRLHTELQACVQLNARLYIILLILVSLLFIVALWAVAHDWISGGTHYSGVLTGLGITATGSIEIMRRISKEWSQARLLLALAGELPEGQMQVIIGKLLEVA